MIDPAPPIPPLGRRSLRRADPRVVLAVARRALAVLLVLLAGVVLATGHGQVCSGVLTPSGAVVPACRPPTVSDGVVVVFALLVLLLLLPDLAEFGVPGLLTLKRRVAEQESALATEREYRELMTAEIDSIQASLSVAAASATARSGAVGVVVMSPSRTAELAAGERPPLAPTAAVTQARYNAAELLMRRLRAEPGELLTGCTLHMYLPDEEQRLLVTVLEGDVAEPRRLGEGWRGGEGWAVGQGIVGRVWRDGDAIVARGADIMSGLNDVPETRRERYRGVAVVVAVPVVNANDRVVAVLAAHAPDPASRLDSAEGLAQVLALAEVLARVLVDLLGWVTDAP